MAYVKVAEDETLEDIMELPLEDDNSLLLSTVTAQFPGATGLKFKVEGTGSMRGVRLVEGRLLAPVEGSWSDHTYICTFPKAQKRKAEEIEDKKDEIIGGGGGQDSNKRKTIDLIVLGLPYSFDEKQMRDYFSSFGEVTTCEVKKDFATGKSKGFGFIQFKEYSAQLEVLSKKHLIGGRLCEVKVPDHKSSEDPASHRLFVGRLPDTITEEDIRKYFSKYGDIVDVYLPRQPFRGFAFVTFVDPLVTSTVIKESHRINGHSVHLQEATPRVSKTKAQERRDMGWSGTDTRMQPDGTTAMIQKSNMNAAASASYEQASLPGGQAAAAQIAAAVAAALAQAGVTPGGGQVPSHQYTGQGQSGYGQTSNGGYNQSQSSGYSLSQSGGYSGSSSSSGYPSGYGGTYQGARGGRSDYRGGYR